MKFFTYVIALFALIASVLSFDSDKPKKKAAKRAKTAGKSAKPSSKKGKKASHKGKKKSYF